jgi:alginate O-acetyltransferase complex protein AlgI
LSGSLAFKSRPAEGCAIVLTFLAVTFAWIPFRADSLADTLKMLSYIADPTILSSLWGSIESQFSGLKEGLTSWFKPRELWPQVLPPNFLATETRPLGLLLLGVGIATFTMPNTYQIFARFKPALGLPEETGWQGALDRLDWRVAFVVSGMFLLSVLRLSHVSPFLYYQF